nr:G protein-coupled receptor [Proales similis]
MGRIDERQRQMNESESFLSNGSAKSISDPTLTKIEVSVMSAVFFLAVAGNFIVIVSLLRSIRKNKRLRDAQGRFSFQKFPRMSFYVINLSLADMAVAFMSIFPTIIWRHIVLLSTSNILCKLITFSQVFSVYVSTFSIVLISLDRFSFVCKPLIGKRWTLTGALKSVAFTWILAALLASPQLFIFSVQTLSVGNFQVITCYARWPSKSVEIAYVTYHAVFQFFCPLLLLTIFYSKIVYCVAKYYQRESECQNEHQCEYEMVNTTSYRTNTNRSSLVSTKRNRLAVARQASMSRSKLKTLKLTLAVITAFILSGLPFYLSVLANVIFGQQLRDWRVLFLILSLLFQLNSCANPIIYLAFNFNSRRCMRKCLLLN